MAKKKIKTTQDHLDSIQTLLDATKGVTPKRILDDGGVLLSKHFTANGNTYIVLDVEQSFNVARAEAHYVLESMFAKAKSLESMVADSKKSVELVNGLVLGKTTLTDLVVHLNEMHNNYYVDNLQRNHIALYECTLFIVKSGDDITDWSFEKAESYITDWLKEGIYAPDFFYLAMQRFTRYTKILREGMESGYIQELSDQEKKRKQAVSKRTPKSNK